ncbi:phage portal protein [Nocardioides sp. YR527]|uniref:phage portal protein n=1 Tax=Nocardioides sp. YR527 TaxID=1881028 RepID=UPI0015A14307|nr:phage portal protein [Nocardioides sp. YR527]
MWPPAHIEPVRADILECDTWYSGDPERLRTFYEGGSSAPAHPNRASQYAGGIKGKVARWWWGVPTPAGETPVKLHVPLAADLCATSSDLLFSEAPNLTAAEDEETLGQFLADLLEDGLVSVLQEAAEVAAAHGGVYLRNVWNLAARERPWTSVVHADMAVPVFRYGRLHEVTFWQQLHGTDSNSQVVWRLLEHHAVGYIEHGLFKGTSDNIGQRVPLQDHPDAEYLAPLVDAESRQKTGILRLTAQYIPNQLPNRLHRGSRQGRSDLQGLLPLLDSLDEAYSSWQRDIRHAKSRLHVPAQYLESMGPGEGAITQLDKEVYIPIQGMLAGGDSLQIDAQQFEIRVEEHKATCAEWTKTIIESAGYSTQSLTSDGGSAVTAAEVHSHERRSYMTRGKKELRWIAALREHVEVQVEIANALGAGIAGDGVQIEFQDGVQDSALNLAQTAMALRNAEAASTETRVRMVHPDWDDTQIEEEAAKIMAETGGGAPMPVPEDAGF